MRSFKSLRLFVFLMPIALGACATAAQRQMEGMKQTLVSGIASTTACINDVQSNPKYSSLSKYMPPQNDDFTMEQLSNQSIPTIAEAKLYTQFSNDMKSCKKTFLEASNKTSPLLGSVVLNTNTRTDNVSVEIIQRKITWGEAARRFKEISAAANADYMQAAAQIDNSLNQQHQAEMQQRQEAGAAMQRAGYAMQQSAYQQQMLNQNQQIINNMNRPVNTTCNGFGNTVNCTSY